MIILDIVLMLFTFTFLSVLILSTRKYDSAGWWLYRLLMTFSAIDFIYLAYGVYVSAGQIPFRMTIIRYGYVALAASMLLSWYLLTKKSRQVRENNFKNRIATIFKKEVKSYEQGN